MSLIEFSVDGAASLSSLQGVVASTQALRSQGPSLTPSLANYFRADLIAHVTNWPADLLEKQVSVWFCKYTRKWNKNQLKRVIVEHRFSSPGTKVF